ncbi:heat-inducible transcriptional repressor HrcA [Rhabdochlamydiaceae symbiont of Dictyostelium giganteum]|uniref:heat-inducible transcriptional repressor HrcA n=1 Tax=Rhabdochlamydiaceae symbiont of Dictyostelium giganteum TaxID=3342349 RepID=UPI00384C2F43
MKSLAPRKPPKDQRERFVLIGLIELYLETGKPVGSNTLRENGFSSLSSATIRNYFSKLEAEGLLKQQHSSGGRIPTSLAYQLYAEMYLKSPTLDEKELKIIKKSLVKETRELASYLQQAAEIVSEIAGCAVFLSSPRFDQDFVMDIKLVLIDSHRCLCVLITDFGLVHTEILYLEKKLSNFTLKRLERFFHYKFKGMDKPTLSAEEEVIGNRFYNEMILRHLVGSTHNNTPEITKTGFSRLLSFADFNDATALAEGLGLFENKAALQSLLQECCKSGNLSCWIGGTLKGCSAIAVPYRINQTVVGAIAILGPHRIPYRKLFGTLLATADSISLSLTKSLYKFRISFRQPEGNPHPICLLLENKNA